MLPDRSFISCTSSQMSPVNTSVSDFPARASLCSPGTLAGLLLLRGGYSEIDKQVYFERAGGLILRLLRYSGRRSIVLFFVDLRFVNLVETHAALEVSPQKTAKLLL